MNSKDYSRNMYAEDEENEINFQFQDFGQQPGTSNTNEQTSYFNSFPDSATEDQEQRLLGDDASEKSSGQSHAFWTFEYYQQFFNVESKQVGDRILWSVLPKPGVNYLQSYIRPNPDLYGPFWICVTLVMTTAIAGNLSNYLQMRHSFLWRYDFHKVTLATTFIFSYAWLVPVLLWALLHWRGSKSNLSLLELICLYGYSLAIFVPVSLLWMVPLRWLQWCLGIVAAVLSGSVLVRTVRPAFSHDAKRVAAAVALLILVLHAVLTLGFMLYFFYTPHNSTLDHGFTPTPSSAPDAYVAPKEQKIPDAEKTRQSERSVAGFAESQSVNNTDDAVISRRKERHKTNDSSLKNAGVRATAERATSPETAPFRNGGDGDGGVHTVSASNAEKKEQTLSREVGADGNSGKGDNAVSYSSEKAKQNLYVRQKLPVTTRV